MLIIEDEYLIAEDLAYIAEQAGATSVAMASTEDEAVQAAHRQMPGIIFSDVKLLAGTGTHAVQTIRSTFGEVPVIFITGSPEDCPQGEPAVVVLIKPFDPGCLMETFRRLAPI